MVKSREIAKQNVLSALGDSLRVMWYKTNEL